MVLLSLTVQHNDVSVVNLSACNRLDDGEHKGHVTHPYRLLDRYKSVRSYLLRCTIRCDTEAKRPLCRWLGGTLVLLKLLSVWWMTLWIWHLSSPAFAFCTCADVHIQCKRRHTHAAITVCQYLTGIWRSFSKRRKTFSPLLKFCTQYLALILPFLEIKQEILATYNL